MSPAAAIVGPITGKSSATGGSGAAGPREAAAATRDPEDDGCDSDG